MKSNTQITFANGKIIDVKETFGELNEKINGKNDFIYVTQINSYIIGQCMQNFTEKTVLININHIASIEPI